MDKTERTSLARHVGHMGYEQVQQLLDETGEKMDEHRENHCPKCVWRKESECDPCDVHLAMGDDWLAKRGAYSETSGNDRMFAIMQIHRLQKDCPNCKYREWDSFESCEYGDELHEKYHIFAQRLSRLEHKETLRQFEQAHGRAPTSKIEIVEWVCAQP